MSYTFTAVNVPTLTRGTSATPNPFTEHMAETIAQGYEGATRFTVPKVKDTDADEKAIKQVKGQIQSAAKGLNRTARILVNSDGKEHEVTFWLVARIVRKPATGKTTPGANPTK